MFNIIRKIISTILLFAVFLVVIGFIYEYVSSSIAEKDFPPLGEFVDVGGHRLHYIKKGTGALTVVFDAGLGGGSLSWSRVQDKVSEQTETISYDRAGFSWSERGNNTKSAKSISAELHRLLEKTGVENPYILVLHSMSGLTLRPFIRENGADIAGVVLVESSHPQQLKKFPESADSLLTRTPVWLTSFANSIGVTRLLFDQTYPNTDQKDLINIRSNALRPKSISTMAEEAVAFKSIVASAGEIESFGDIPLLVITGNSTERWKYLQNKEREEKYASTWTDLQKSLLELSSNSTQIFADKSGHLVQIEQPEIIIDAILKLAADIVEDRKSSR